MCDEPKTYLVGIASDRGRYPTREGGEPRTEPFPVMHKLFVVPACSPEEAIDQVAAAGERLEPGMSLVVSKAREFVVRQSMEEI